MLGSQRLNTHFKMVLWVAFRNLACCGQLQNDVDVKLGDFGNDFSITRKGHMTSHYISASLWVLWIEGYACWLTYMYFKTETS